MDADRVEHRTTVSFDVGPAEHGCRAECVCGWASESYGNDEAGATSAALEHEDHAANRIGFTRVVDELLDLGDDLAELVVWFVDNWTRDLPIPYLYGRRPGRDGQLLELVVICLDRGELARLAAVLEAPVCETERQATTSRWFGRVLVEGVVSFDFDQSHELVGAGL